QLSYWRICNCHSERSAAESKNLSKSPDQRCLDFARHDNSLIQNLAHATRADGFATLANGEPDGLFHRDGRDQLHFNRDVVAGHHHLHAFSQFHGAGHIRGAEIKLWPVIGEKWSVTAAFLFAQHVNFRLKFLMWRDGAGLRDHLAALDLLFLQAAQQNADVIARTRFIEKLAEHFDVGRNRLGGRTNTYELDFLHLLEN